MVSAVGVSMFILVVSGLDTAVSTCIIARAIGDFCTLLVVIILIAVTHFREGLHNCLKSR